ncbi:MAG: Ti-type conjugative transfer relaxase TraA [Rhodobiaceae bacterium]|nr:Ti-type conjugative transfer relaxase TraA [Rhodobiaceae bacterium]
MAIYHLSVKAISRGDGRSAVAAAAYRRGARMEHRAEERVSDYSRKEHVAHSELGLPEDCPEWLQEIAAKPGNQASEELWNFYSEFETRKNALLAREMVIALPVELTVEQNIELVQDFIGAEFSSHGVVTDWSIHDEDGNPHAHVMILPRRPTLDGFGPKSMPITNGDGEVVFRENGQPMYQPVVGSRSDLARWREQWAGIQNEHLQRQGHDVRVDHRSNKDRGIALVPTRHIGPAGVGMWEQGRSSDRYDQYRQTLAENGRRILDNPDEIIRKVAQGRSVFSENDLIKEAGKYLASTQDIEVFRVRAMASPELVMLAEEVRHETQDWVLSAAKYTSQEMLSIETEMAGLASKMVGVRSHAITLNQGKAALKEFSFLGHEQQVAVEHVLIDKQLSSVVGFAGSGKTTMVEAAKHGWEAAGYTVKGGALSGIAAQGLGDGAGIESRTLASWEYAWKEGREVLTAKDVLVIDEAGMIGSRQMRDVLARANDAGAKVVLIGDAEQLQPIEAGAAFRAISEQTGSAVISEIRRQHEGWMREASKNFATHKTEDAFAAYQSRGHVVHELTADLAKDRLVADWMDNSSSEGSQIILAHRRIDVADLNLRVRDSLVESGQLGAGSTFEVAGGAREFAPGEQVIFQSNDRALGVKNGMLGRIEAASGNTLDVRVGPDGGSGQVVNVDLKSYSHVDYGYAATIHKSQGVTVDRSFVYGSSSMDRHLTNVSMTRHRDDVKFYSSADEFKDPSKIGAKLSRARLQSTTLDYLERRQPVPEQDRVAYLRQVYERQVDRLQSLAERLAEIPAQIKQRFGIAVEEPSPVVGADSDLPQKQNEERARPGAKSYNSETIGRETQSESKFGIKPVSTEALAKLRTDLLSDTALKQHISADPVVVRELAEFKETAGYVGEGFQTEISRSGLDLLTKNSFQDLMKAHRLSAPEIKMMTNSFDLLKSRVEGAEKNYVQTIEIRLKQATIEVPPLSSRALKFAEEFSEIKDPNKASAFIKNVPHAKQSLDEVASFEKAMKRRFGVTSLRDIEPSAQLGLKIAKINPDTLVSVNKLVARTQSKVGQVQRMAQSLIPGRGITPGT